MSDIKRVNMQFWNINLTRHLYSSVGQRYWGVNESKDSVRALESAEIMERREPQNAEKYTSMSEAKPAYCTIYPRAIAGIEIL